MGLPKERTFSGFAAPTLFDGAVGACGVAALTAATCGAADESIRYQTTVTPTYRIGVAGGGLLRGRSEIASSGETPSHFSGLPGHGVWGCSTPYFGFGCPVEQRDWGR